MLVSARQVARFWGVTPLAVRQAGETGLLRQHPVGDPADRERDKVRYDAEEVLEKGHRPFVDEDQLRRTFDAYSILFVQQSGPKWLHVDDSDYRWRTGYGWSEAMSEQQKLLSACGWWPVDPRRRAGVRGIVSTVSSFVVTLAVVDEGDPIGDKLDAVGKVRFNVHPATAETPMGLALLTVFGNRRLPVKAGSSRLIPRPDGPAFG